MFEALYELLDKIPFQPFRIVTNSGKSYEVENPHNVAVSKTLVSIFPPRTEGWVLIRITEVTAVESATLA
jgi:hypothetical protein